MQYILLISSVALLIINFKSMYDSLRNKHLERLIEKIDQETLITIIKKDNELITGYKDTILECIRYNKLNGEIRTIKTSKNYIIIYL